MERPTTGTSYPTIDDRDVENIDIPILPDEIRKKIAFLVQQSHEARKKSKDLLEQARTRVEKAINESASNFG